MTCKLCISGFLCASKHSVKFTVTTRVNDNITKITLEAPQTNFTDAKKCMSWRLETTRTLQEEK